MRYRPNEPRHVPEPRPEPLSPSALRGLVKELAARIMDDAAARRRPEITGDLILLARRALSAGHTRAAGELIAARRRLSDDNPSAALASLRSVLDLLDGPRRAA
jgi:hypothetical protein